MNEWGELITPDYRYIFLKGGRSSAKSHETAGYLVETHATEPHENYVCLREVQKSIKYSSKQLIQNKMSDYGILQHYRSLQAEIQNQLAGGVFLFQGMSDLTSDNIKSLEDFKRAWFEEAQNASKKSLKDLLPTIRKQNSQILFTWNPNQPDDPIEELCNSLKDDPRALVLHKNYDENAFLTDTAKEELESDRIRFPDDFDHIWLGGYNVKSEVRVFQNWRVEECEPTFDDELYYGADWGFSQDPSVLLRCWIDEDKKEIYVDHQINRVGVDTVDLPEFFKEVPESNEYIITADSARPETISHMNNNGFNVRPSVKGKGSVESGINWLKGYTIVVHPRCALLQKELRLYSYKVNKAGDILPKVDDQAGLDHCIDALRYALEKLIKSETGGGIVMI
jgi:phage terminase large subunit